MAKLLIVDDELEAATAVAALLRQEGHDATFATTAGEALTELHHNTPDLILLDLTMPYLDGLDLLDAINSDSRFFDVPVAIFTSRCDEHSITEAKRLGAREYILKGMDWEHTYERIRRVLPQPVEDNPSAVGGFAL